MKIAIDAVSDGTLMRGRSFIHILAGSTRKISSSLANLYRMQNSLSDVLDPMEFDVFDYIENMFYTKKGE